MKGGTYSRGGLLDIAMSRVGASLREAVNEGITVYNLVKITKYFMPAAMIELQAHDMFKRQKLEKNS